MTKLPAPLLLLALAAPLAAEVTFNEHIAPLIHQNCTGCHRPDQSGPFSLITYRDVKKRSRTIQEVLLDRYMPPWKPTNTNIHFANDRRLSDEQIKLFSAWVKAGAPEGDPSRKPKAPEYPSGWYLGEPDLVVTMNGKFEVPAEGRDIYRSFVFPLQLSEDKWVKAVELRPKARSAVHHALFFIDSSGQARKLDGRDGRAGLNGMGFQQAQFRPGQQLSSSAFDGSDGLGGHVPGATPARLPGDLAMFLPKGSDVVMQTHFHPSGKKEVEQAELALYFADKAPRNELVAIQIPPAFGIAKNIDIPAGTKKYVVSESFTLPVPVDAILINGHAHYICRTMKMTATLPDGSETVLLEIEDWDLDWQDAYQFKKPIALPAGTVLRSRIVYDNSSANPENPNSPPKRMKWGPESDDEMGSITLTVVPRNKEDAAKLAEAQTTQFFMSGLTPNDSNEDGLIQIGEVYPALRGITFSPQFDKDQNQVLDKAELPVALRAAVQFVKGLQGLQGLQRLRRDQPR